MFIRRLDDEFVSYRPARLCKTPLKGMPEKDIKMVGCYVDHELLCNLKEVNERRKARISQKKPIRLLITVGGAGAAGIGGGLGASCGTITIKDTVTKVTDTKGEDTPYSIGKGSGNDNTCGTITIGGVEGALSLEAFTYPVAPATVVEAIDAIGTVAYTKASKAKIDEARTLYTYLKEDQTSSVNNYAKLTVAEATYNAVDNAVNKIDEICWVEYTAECKEAIDEARAAYNALDADQKALVTNAGTLTAAETSYKTLDDTAKANAVVAKINAIGEVEYTTESKEAIDEAKAAYNALTGDQKALVANYETLTTAEP